MSPMYPPLPPVTANSKTALTVALMLKNPQLFRRRISDLAARRDYTGFIFGDGGRADSGAAAFQVAVQNIFTSVNDVEKIAPGAEYPQIEFSDETLEVITIDKYGGEFKVTDEMRDRNQLGIVEQRTKLLVNATVLKTEALAMAVLAAGVSTYSRSGAGNSWADYAALTSSTGTLLNPITEDIVTAVNKPTAEKTPYNYSLAIMNSQEWILLMSVLGNAQKANDYLKGLGIDNTWVTDLQTAGKVKYVDPGMVGMKVYEGQSGVQSKVYRDEGRDCDVVKAFEKPGFAITDPLAIWEQTGAAA